ncbi:toxin-antitoxin system YwqK family antitoxin [Chlamydiifrater phoenicopteri]|uniref:toxin-antitoxin system YwqK family antitoxin n=1 Tax=Chlamydiifrater phoenicopteri TaxID=2681469 RepID=UPI001FE3709A|nr:hypothetical protein [Chlamydiifrater phoenicopteri]
MFTKTLSLVLIISSFALPAPLLAASKKNSTTSSKTYENLVLVSINIIDRNGLSETISSKERLKKYAKVDFLQPQPYKQVSRMYRNKQGELVSCLTSYHENGQLKQYLECVNNRANGRYREWFSNGKIKIKATVIGGIADLHPSAESGWLFHGSTLAYNDEGSLIASILYEKGFLEGESTYFHDNGAVWKKCSYHKGLAEGEFSIFSPSGTLIKTSSFVNGKKEGVFIRYTDSNSQKILSQEEFKNDKLLSGVYYNDEGELLSSVTEGHGLRTLYGKTTPIEVREYHEGVCQGRVEILDPKTSQLTRSYNLINDMKEGEEIIYYPNTKTPKLLMTWHQNVLQGPVKTWYQNGSLESSKELVNNKKSGLCTFRYPNGKVMATEEYDKDLLIKGEYFRPEDKTPCSKVEKGYGTAVFFSPSGSELKKIWYQDGKPSLQQ